MFVVIADYGTDGARVVAPIWDQHSYAVAAADQYSAGQHLRTGPVSQYTVHAFDEVIDRMRVDRR
jgi:hypothetical protein